jgi:hypothetical protein
MADRKQTQGWERCRQLSRNNKDFPIPTGDAGSAGGQVAGAWSGEVDVRERGCCLRDFNFLGLVVLITAVETVDNPGFRLGSAVKPCSWAVGSACFKQAVDGDKIFGLFR